MLIFRTMGVDDSAMTLLGYGWDTAIGKVYVGA